MKFYVWLEAVGGDQVEAAVASDDQDLIVTPKVDEVPEELMWESELGRLDSHANGPAAAVRMFGAICAVIDRHGLTDDAFECVGEYEPAGGAMAWYYTTSYPERWEKMFDRAALLRQAARHTSDYYYEALELCFIELGVFKPR